MTGGGRVTGSFTAAPPRHMADSKNSMIFILHRRFFLARAAPCRSTIARSAHVRADSVFSGGTGVMARFFQGMVVMALAVFAGSWLMGQDSQPPRVRGQLYSKWRELGLTDEQKQKVYRIQTEYRAKI